MSTRRNRYENTQNNTTTSTVAASPDIDALRGGIGGLQVDPSIAYQYGRAREDVKHTYKNPYGAYRTPYLTEGMQKSELAQLNDQEQAASQGAYNDLQRLRLGARGELANLTAPRTTTSSGTTRGYQEGPSFWAGLATSAVSGAGAAAIQ